MTSPISETAAAPKGLEIEKKFLVISSEWQKAVQNICAIQQSYFPDLSRNIFEGGIFLRLAGLDKVVRVSAFHPEHGIVCSFPVPEETLEKFGRENLRYLRRGDEVVPLGGEIEARIRLKNGEPLFAIKAATGTVGKRYELEFVIGNDVAEKLLPYCSETVAKLRHTTIHDGNLWEVDEYSGANEGLITAELELHSADQSFVKPDWVGQEITDNVRYANRSLAKRPYGRWKTNELT